jgi:hypothetical protein
MIPLLFKNSENEIVSEIFMKKQGIWQQCDTDGKEEDDNSNGESVVTVMEAATMV